MTTICNQINIYRKRYFPNELIHLKNDIILHTEQNLIVTKWNTLRPRTDIACGISAYLIDKNIKVSKIFDCHQQLVHWYCDIILTEQTEEHTFIFTDLLIDIIIDPDCTVHVVDMDELGDYIQNGTISPELACLALHAADHLLRSIENGEFKQYQHLLDSYTEASPS